MDNKIIETWLRETIENTSLIELSTLFPEEGITLFRV